jgi:hypothetical protein
MKSMTSILMSFNETYIIMDNLAACQGRDRVLNYFEHLNAYPTPNIKLLLTTRPAQVALITVSNTWTTITVDCSTTIIDLCIHLSWVLAKHGAPIPDKAASRIFLEDLLIKVAGSFLWIKLLDNLLGSLGSNSAKTILKTPPIGLS